MPELPEVEFTKRSLVRWVGKRKLQGVSLGPHATARDVAASQIGLANLPTHLLSIERVGKYLHLDFGSFGFSVHLGMTGKWLPMPLAEARARHIRMVMHFHGVSIAFIDARKFGYIDKCTKQQWLAQLLSKRVGPDVFAEGLTPEVFYAKVCRGRVAIKVALLDQKRVAGVGNIYACEALFLAKIDPFLPAGLCSLPQSENLLAALRKVMIASLERESGDEIYYLTDGNPVNPFMVYGRSDQPCIDCAGTVVKKAHGGRSTFYCEACQLKGAS